MSRKTDTVVACTIGIDTGKNTLHLIGLDDRGAIVLREKLDSRPDCSTACECAAVPNRYRGRHGDALRSSRADRARS